MDSPTYGATPQEWEHFVKLGLAEDLLPVVSNPHATIASLSKMKDLGKTPSKYNRDGHVVGIPDWTRQRSTERQVGGWSKAPDYGICVQTRRVRAVDIDIDDVEQAMLVVEMIEMVLGPLPRRRRADSGKCLLLVWMEGDFTKRVLRTPHGAIEFLATGQQFIACGTHPRGQRYEWVGGLPAEVPVVAPVEFEALWQGLATALGSVDERARRGVMPAVPRSKDDSWGDQMVPWLADNGWVREYDRDGRVHIRCPWEAEHTTDSGPSATTYFPAGVGGFQQGHFRCLHAHCTSRTDQDFLDEMGLGVVNDFEPVEEVVPAHQAGAGGVVAGGAGGVPGFEDQGPWPKLTRMRKSGRLEPTATNAQGVMSRPDIVGLRLAYDVFKDQVMITRPGWGAWRPIKDTDYFEMRCNLERIGFEKPGKELVRDAALWVAQHHRMDSAIEWGTSLQWDGVPRIGNFLAKYLRAADTPYTRAVSRYMWTAMAGRLMVPGIKTDMVPVLVSAQGTGKTSMVEALAPEPDAFVEINLGLDDDKLARMMRGKLVAEIAELRGLQGRDAEANKAWISRRFEEWVPKWSEHATKFGRRVLFIGTSNKEFLDDETGERRWLPVSVGEVDLVALRADVTQMWAEAIARFEAGGVDWQDAEVLAREEHAAFKVTDPWAESVERWLDSDGMDGAEGPKRGDSPVALSDVLTSALGLNLKEITRTAELRVAKILSRLGYVKKDVKVGGKGLKRWIRLAQVGGRSK